MDTSRISLSANLGISKQNISPNDTVLFLLTVKNTGEQTLTGITASINLEGNFTYLQNTAILSYPDEDPFSINNISGTNVSFVLPRVLEPEESVIISFAVSVSENIDAGNTAISQAVIVTNEIPSGQASNAVITNTMFARISVCKRQSDTGSSYVIELTNTGNLIAENIVISDILPCTFRLRDVYLGNERLIPDSDYNICDGCITITLPCAILPGNSVCLSFID